MLITCYYFDQVRQEYYKTSFWEMLQIEKEDYSEFMRRKSTLCRREDGKIPMVMVKNGLHHGFRRKGSSEGNRTGYTRGEKESLTHQGNKEVIASMDELIIKTNGEAIRLYIESTECEKAVICRGKRYEIDIYIKLRKTEPMEYYHKWNGELWFEVFHTCPVDYSQAEDFGYENKTLFEYKVSDDYDFFDNITEEGYVKRKQYIKSIYTKRGIEGIIICQTRNADKMQYLWRRSPNGNMTARIGDTNFTIIASRFDNSYGIVYGESLIKWDYNKRKFLSEEEAMKMAEYFSFLLYNKINIKNL